MKRRLFLNIIILLILVTGSQILRSCKEVEKEMVVLTGSASDILITSADVSGEIIDLGDGAIKQHGHCYSTTPDPTLSNSKTELNVPLGIGGFVSHLSNLTAGTNYYVKAYIRNENEIKYGDEISFKTHAGFIVTTASLSSITSISAQSGGSIVDDGGLTVTSCGVCWSTDPDPTTSSNHTSDTPGSGSFTSTLAGLSSGRTYYFRAYAINSSGTVYGNELNFLTPVTDIDGNIYKTVKIGTQVWMAENLKTTHYRNGIAIPNITDNTEWSNLDDLWKGAYCDYNNTVSSVYGKLYNGFAVEDARKICPTDWHIPSVDEWTTLINYLGGYNEASGRLKESGTTHWKSPNTGTNESGFTALPGGYRWYDGVFHSFTEMAVFWATGVHYGLFNTSNTLMSEGASSTEGNSVRCIRD
jgi:uncharacterized protein (TIGR02145 family)